MTMTLDRRTLLTLGAAAGAAGLVGCAVQQPGSSPTPSGGAPTWTVSPSAASPSATRTPTQTPAPSPTADGRPRVRLGQPIGDGSQAPSPDPQPNQRPIAKLAAGERPPQFVVFSWDGASGNEDAILDYVDAVHEVGGTQTMFLSGLYFLPLSKRTEYHPPRRKPGASDINFMSDPTVRRTIIDTAIAWTYGNEIGTHFCGHFDGSKWTTADWEQEVAETYKLVTTWRTITGWTDIDPLPFDYTRELVGARTPLLAGRETLLPVVAKKGWRYDSSGVRPRPAWPRKDKHGLYDMSMFSVPFRSRTIVPMDYNFLYQHAKGKTDAGSASERAEWKAEHAATLRNALKICLNGNRAPLIIGNHMSPWVGGIYQQNLRTLITEFGKTPDVQLVSHRWLCDWLDAQDADVLKTLQAS